MDNFARSRRCLTAIYVNVFDWFFFSAAMAAFYRGAIAASNHSKGFAVVYACLSTGFIMLGLWVHERFGGTVSDRDEGGLCISSRWRTPEINGAIEFTAGLLREQRNESGIRDNQPALLGTSSQREVETSTGKCKIIIMPTYR